MSKNLKVVLAGDESVGKTSLVRRFVDDKFSEQYKKTLGFEISVKAVEVSGAPIVFSIWDVGGEKFKRQQKNYYTDARGVFVVFDLSKEDSFKHVPKWVQYVRSVVPTSPVIIVGNKSDLCDDAPGCVALDMLEDVTRRVEAVWCTSTSAKTGENVEEMFSEMALHILSNA
ncbi:MAG: Rab family GTPase [Promethearchaeota archaeon]